jgi:hypothetical protein
MYAIIQARKRETDSESRAFRMDGRGREGVRAMKKLIAVGILIGTMAVSAIPALADNVFKSCSDPDAIFKCSPTYHTTCTVRGDRIDCTMTQN